MISPLNCSATRSTPLSFLSGNPSSFGTSLSSHTFLYSALYVGSFFKYARTNFSKRVPFHVVYY